MATGAVAGAVIAMRIESATAGTFTDLAGLRAKSISVNNEAIDTTNSDSTGRWVTKLAALASRSVSISGDGVFIDGAGSDRLRTMAVSANPIARFQFHIPTFGTFEGLFFIQSLEFSGDHDAEMTFSLSAESAGEISFTNIV